MKQPIDQPERIAEKDWDGLIFLDSCRHDSFRRVTRIDTPVAKVPSQGTHEYIHRVIKQQDFTDTVLIAGNSMFGDVDCRADFYDIYKAYLEFEEVNGVKVVPPWNVIGGFYNMYNRYGSKTRYILWFIQPHYPLVPEGISASDMKLKDIAEQMGLGKLKELYRDNIKFVLQYVLNLGVENRDKWYITADHAQLFGEGGYWGHAANRTHDKVFEVPWISLDNLCNNHEILFDTIPDNLRVENIIEGEHKSVDLSVEEQLEELGYK